MHAMTRSLSGANAAHQAGRPLLYVVTYAVMSFEAAAAVSYLWRVLVVPASTDCGARTAVVAALSGRRSGRRRPNLKVHNSMGYKNRRPGISIDLVYVRKTPLTYLLRPSPIQHWITRSDPFSSSSTGNKHCNSALMFENLMPAAGERG